MKCPAPSFLSSRTKATTLIEFLAAVAISGVVLAAIGLFWYSSTRNFAVMINYLELNANSQEALDNLTKQIRETLEISQYSTNKLVFTDYDSNPMILEWNPTTRQVYRVKNGTTNVYLTDCDFLRFSMYKRTPRTSPAMSFYSATNDSGAMDPKVCKLVNINWRCSRTIFGKKINTESVQTTQVVIRNKRVTE